MAGREESMHSGEIVRLTNELVQKYYNNELELFFEYLDEKVLWYGPAKGQFLSGRDAILKAWSGEKHSLRFLLGNVKLDHISPSRSCLEVMMSFSVTTLFPDESRITMDQIIHVTWRETRLKGQKGSVPRMLVIHISDLYEKHLADNIYPVHLNEIYRGRVPILQTGKRIHFRGIDSTDLYLLSDTIIWVQSMTYGRHSLLHTTEGDFPVASSTAVLEKEYPEFLLRCHKSHLVNCDHIAGISRFTVTLSDGTSLPIPEKKYTAFKKAVYEKWADNTMNNDSRA